VLYDALGFFDEPQIRAPVSAVAPVTSSAELRVSPLQLALAAAALSNGGELPAPRIALAVVTPVEGPVILPPLATPRRVFEAGASDRAALQLAAATDPYWLHIDSSRQPHSSTTWVLIGTLPDWQGPPLVCVVVLEEDHAALAASIARGVMDRALGR
jgi:hypothetical protein